MKLKTTLIALSSISTLLSLSNPSIYSSPLITTSSDPSSDCSMFRFADYQQITTADHLLAVPWRDGRGNAFADINAVGEELDSARSF